MGSGPAAVAAWAFVVHVAETACAAAVGADKTAVGAVAPGVVAEAVAVRGHRMVAGFAREGQIENFVAALEAARNHERSAYWVEGTDRYLKVYLKPG